MQEPPPSLGHLTFAVIGAGRVGASLAAGIAATGRTLLAVAAATPASAGALAARLGDPALACEPRVAVRRADVIFLAVPDGLVEVVAAGLPWRTGQLAVHCSGARGLDALAAAGEAGADTGCFHPIQTFPSREPDPTRFRGIFAGIECSGDRSGVIEELAEDLGATPFSLEGINRALYHAAAVFVGNDVVALVTAAVRSWALAGLPRAIARPALAPLLLTAAGNAARMDAAEALTGPIARGDAATVARHLEALRADPALAGLYIALARELLRDAAAAPRAGRDDVMRMLEREAHSRGHFT